MQAVAEVKRCRVWQPVWLECHLKVQVSNTNDLRSDNEF